jgi:pyruvate dehydrogenase (quinone)/pyruvate oxidase
MKTTASDILVDAIHDWGVDVVFGLPGDGINGIMEALRKRAEKIRFVQVRHEEAAAFMARAYAKYTGKLGVCLATSGPGGIHLMNGLYDAKLDGQPVLAITGLQYHELVQTHTQQDVELDKVLVQAVVDPHEPPMPPKVSMKQAEKFAESLLRGEPNRGKIISTVAEDRVRELV